MEKDLNAVKIIPIVFLKKIKTNILFVWMSEC